MASPGAGVVAQAAGVASVREAIRAMRGAVGLARMPRMRVLSLSAGAAAHESLDDLCTMNLPPVDMGATGLWLDEQARVIASVLTVRGARQWTLVVDAEIEPIAHAWSHLRAGARAHVLAYVVLEVVGPGAPALMAAVFGREVAELPLFGACDIPHGTCVRFTKAGEHGFTLVLPPDDAASVESRLRAVGVAHGLVALTPEAIDACALRNGIPGVSCVGAYGLTPAEAELEWLTSSDKVFVGCCALQRRRRVRAPARLVTLAARGDIPAGARVLCGGADVGEVLAVAPADDPDETVASALVHMSYADATTPLSRGAWPSPDKTLQARGIVLATGESRVPARVFSPARLLVEARADAVRNSSAQEVRGAGEPSPRAYVTMPGSRGAEGGVVA